MADTDLNIDSLISRLLEGNILYINITGLAVDFMVSSRDCFLFSSPWNSTGQNSANDGV